MKIEKFLLCLFLAGFVSVYSTYSQSWIDQMNNPDANFYEIYNEAHNFFDSVPEAKSNNPQLYKEYALWEYFWKTRINYPPGNLTGNMKYLNYAIAKYLQSPPSFCQNTFVNSNWSLVGPTTDPILGSNTFSGQNMGLMRSLWVCPGNKNIIYAGSNYGGLFRTTNALDPVPVWENITDISGYPVNGIKYIVVVPGDVYDVDDDIIYIASGTSSCCGTNAGKIRAGYGLGVLKSTNGGTTWQQTDLSYTLSNKVKTNNLLMHPTNSNILYAITEEINPWNPSSIHVYKTTNGGVNWIDLNFPNINTPLVDIKFAPNDPDKILVSGSEIWVFDNTGNTWSDFTAGLPISSNPIVNIVMSIYGNDVYVLYVENTGSGCNKVIIRNLTNNLSTWVTINQNVSGPSGCSFNLFEVSTVDPLIMYIGAGSGSTTSDGLMWKSTDGGLSFQKISCYNKFYNGSASSCNFTGTGTYTHADVRAMALYFSSTGGSSDILYVANDGGMMKTIDGGISWININGTGLSVTQFNGLGSSEITPYKIAGGASDNGIYIFGGNVWKITGGGDANDCIFDALDAQKVYCKPSPYYYLSKSNDAGNSWNPVYTPCDFIPTPNCTIPSASCCVSQYYNYPMLMLETNNTFYVGYHDIWKIQNPSVNLTNLSSSPWVELPIPMLGLGSALYTFDVSQSNPDIIYAAYDFPAYTDPPVNRFFKTTDGGATWTDITSGLYPDIWYSITDVVINPENPDELWVTFGDFKDNPTGSGKGEWRVYYSEDGGTTWADHSNGLPEFPVNCIVYEKGSDDGLYIGTDVGVFYTNNQLYQQYGWVCFNENFPLVMVTDLEINYSTSSILAATYGRGIWKSPLACPSNNITVNGTVNSGFYQAKNVTITDATLTASTDNITVRATDEIVVTPANGEVVISATGTEEVRLYIQSCDDISSAKKSNFNNGVLTNTDISISSEPIKSDKTQKEINPTLTGATIQIIPNPASSKINFQVSGDWKSKNFHIEMTDVLGRTVFVKNNFAPGVANPIDLSHLQKGIYFLKISTEDGIRVEKIILQ